MSNFKEVFLAGKEGRNMGLPTGIDALDEAINGLQKGMSIGIAAAPKVGKTTLADFAFVLSPYLHMLNEGKLDNINWIYFSYEVSRISKEFKFASFFMSLDYGVRRFEYKGKVYDMNQSYLMGKQLHREGDTKERIVITREHEDMVKEIYYKRIIPMFGEYDSRGNRIRPGKIDFISAPENPTGVYKYLWKYAEENGRFIRERYTSHDEGEKERVVDYEPRNRGKYTIVVVDHIRKFRKERGFFLKENIDKWLEYTTLLRNLCNFTFVNVCHSNRGVSNTERLKFAKDLIFPTADDVKDTGNLAEESTVLLTMLNANDEKYNLTEHFGIKLVDHPNYRSIHLAESRETECPIHMQVNMFGGINLFEPLRRAGYGA